MANATSVGTADHDVRARIESLLEEGWDLHLSVPGRARELADEALELSLQAQYAPGRGRALLLVGACKYRMNEDAEPLYREAVSILEHTDDLDGLARAYGFAAFIIGRRGKTEEALGFLTRAVRICEENDLKEAGAYVQMQLGQFYARRKQLTSAMTAFKKSIELSEGSARSPVIALQGLGGIYRELRLFDEALRYFDEAYRSATDDFSRLLALGNRGIVLEEVGRLEDALPILYQACELAERIGDKKNGYHIFSPIPRVYMKLDQLDKAAEAVDRLFAMLPESAEDTDFCNAFQARADLHYHRGDRVAAIADLERALEYAERADTLNQLRDIFFGLSVCHKELGDFKRALEYQERLTKLVQSSTVKQMTQRIHDLEEMHAAENQRMQAQHQSEMFRIRNIELTQANMNLHELQRQTGRMLAVLQHDMRNPLGAIIGFAGIISEESSEEGVRHHAELIEHSGRRLLALVEDIMKSAREGSLRVERENIRIGDLLESVRQVVRPLTESKGIRFDLDDRTQEERFPLDETKTFQALSNLLFNAIKFTETGKAVGLRAEILPAAMKEGKPRRLRLYICDEGIGMSQAFLQQLFPSPYELGAYDGHGDGARLKTQRSGTLGEPGSGMGIAIARSIVELQNGTMTASSREGEGTTIEIELPEQ